MFQLKLFLNISQEIGEFRGSGAKLKVEIWKFLIFRLPLRLYLRASGCWCVWFRLRDKSEELAYVNRNNQFLITRLFGIKNQIDVSFACNLEPAVVSFNFWIMSSRCCWILWKCSSSPVSDNQICRKKPSEIWLLSR